MFSFARRAFPRHLGGREWILNRFHVDLPSASDTSVWGNFIIDCEFNSSQLCSTCSCFLKTVKTNLCTSWFVSCLLALLPARNAFHPVMLLSSVSINVANSPNQVQVHWELSTSMKNGLFALTVLTVRNAWRYALQWGQSVQMFPVISDYKYILLQIKWMMLSI